MAYVFQYGSNTLTSRLNSETRLRGDARSLGAVYTEEDFDLDFTVSSITNQCAAADIVSGSGRKIWGVLYEIPDSLIRKETADDRKSLDAVEGPKYERRSISLRYPDGSPVQEEVITYVVSKREHGIKTSLDYCQNIIAGLREHDVPEEYIDYVRGRIIANNPNLENDVKAL